MSEREWVEPHLASRELREAMSKACLAPVTPADVVRNEWTDVPACRLDRHHDGDHAPADTVRIRVKVTDSWTLAMQSRPVEPWYMDSDPWLDKATGLIEPE